MARPDIETDDEEDEYRWERFHPGSTPLHLAVEQGHLKIVKLLLEGVGKELPANGYGKTPLHLAAEAGHFEIYKAIMEHVKDKNPSISDNWDRDTAFHIAARNGHTKIAELILRNVKNKNPINTDHATPLHEAAKEGHFDIVQLIFEVGKIRYKEENFKDEDGLTPLYWAMKKGHVEITKLISQHIIIEDLNDAYDIWDIQGAGIKPGITELYEVMLKKAEEIFEANKAEGDDDFSQPNQVQVAQTDENKNRQAPEKDKTLEKVAEKSKDKKPCQFCKKEFINLKLHHAKNEKCKKFLQENAG